MALVLPLAGTARRDAKQTLVVTLDGRFSSPQTSVGAFIAGGAVSDAGTHHDLTRAFPKTGRPTVTTSDLSYTSDPLQPGPPTTPRPTINALRVIDVFNTH
jgi:hypothetical protein